MFPIVYAIVAASMIPVKSPGRLDAQGDSPTVQAVSAGYGKVTLDVIAGPGGAPEGFTVLWMDEADYGGNGSRWYSTPNPAQGEAVFTGSPVFNSWGTPDFKLAPGEKVTVEIGDLLDETGVTTNWNGELTGGTRYVFSAYVNGTPRVRPSDPAPAQFRQTRLETCAFTRQNWSNSPQNWPVNSLFLGNVLYTKAQLLSILQHPPTQNGLVVLSRQLIAAKLNVANGASPTPVQADLTTADLLIGFLTVPPVGSDYLPPMAVRDLVQRLEDFNHGIYSPDPCSPTSVGNSSWGAIKSRYR